MSQRQTGSKLMLKLNCDQIDSKELNEVLMKELRFESVYSDNSKFVLIMRRPSILTDCVCLLQQAHTSSKLYILSRYKFFQIFFQD